MAKLKHRPVHNKSNRALLKDLLLAVGSERHELMQLVRACLDAAPHWSSLFPREKPVEAPMENGGAVDRNILAGLMVCMLAVETSLKEDFHVRTAEYTEYIELRTQLAEISKKVSQLDDPHYQEARRNGDA